MSNTSYQIKPEFSVRIVVCDHYLTKPCPGIDVIYSDFRGSDIKQVPVLRIFGSTPDGHKACLHVHGVFPYFYIPCPVPNPVPQFLYHIAASLDKALNIALKQATSATQHVYKISLVKGLPFYGFHDKDHLYLKVFLYNPGLIKQAVELCSNGAILGQSFQPHESHLNFTLQFFIDFNLFGMSNIDLQTVKFRRSGPLQSSTEPLDSPNEFNLKPDSICYYEVDCVASHIINRQRIGKGDGIENPGLEEVWNQEKERRKQLNVSMACKSLTQSRMGIDQTESHYKYDQMIKIKMSGLINKPVDTNDRKDNLGDVHYPAESIEGSQLFNAVDVSMHLPDSALNVQESLRKSLDETLTDDFDNTMVDENLALNSSLSLHYSQVILNSEDMELLELLEDMDDKTVEDDSVMATPADEEKDEDEDSDDAEYSQIFNENTILLDTLGSKDDADKSSPSWNDSFWDGANIPQLDGTCDDDHVKKVRKRKKRSLQLGLSKVKTKREVKAEKDSEDLDSNVDCEESDEINASRETVESISEHHLKKSVKKEVPSSELLDIEDCYNKSHTMNASVTDLVNKFSTNNENNTEATKGAAELYDLENKFEPKAGPSKVSDTVVCERIPENNTNNWLSDSYESTPEDRNLGIESFYDKSRIFNLSADDINKSLNYEDSTKEIKLEERKIKFELQTSNEITIKASNGFKILTPKIRPPTKQCIISSLEKYNIPETKSLQPYYSDHKDVGNKVEIGQLVLKLKSLVARDQKPFEKVLDTSSIEEWRQLMFSATNETNEEYSKPDILKTLLAGNRQCVITPIKRAPTTSKVMKWLEERDTKLSMKVENKSEYTEIIKINEELDNSQALGLNEDEVNSSISLEPIDKEKCNVNDTSLHVTMQPDGSFLCFGNNESQKESSPDTPSVEVDYLTVMLLEIQASVRGDLHPDPQLDPILAVFITITNDCPPNHFLKKSFTEVIVADNNTPPKYLERCVFNVNVTYVKDENEIIGKVIEMVKKHDPDIMCGHEIEMNSWGYLVERGNILGLEIVRELSRVTEKHRQKRARNDENDFEGRVIGRITFNVWRLFRHELALSSYSFENCMYEILKERVPTFSFAQLDKWWRDESRTMRWMPVEYHLTRLSGTVRMLEKLDMINRTSELARLFGLQWWEVLSRGSQFRVESLMLRAARPLNLVALSPTVKQRAAMKAPECLPLIFEPESRFYSDPVIVLDFQSLYPSMMIAYNYCFSTCIGRVQHINGESAYEFGAWRLRIPKAKLQTLVANGLVNWSPVGVGFVNTDVRRGVLPALLRRILAARQAVKKGMKLQTDEAVKKAMHSRQLGLKLIANVTYGYTAANFSGRMPCVEVADSVVSKGRETLERAIKLVKSHKEWNAKVLYGDTDSMFVLVPGGTRAQAFRLGQLIADAVTADNPAPVALKLEKVYQPCILQTKKRYVGYMYESADQATPVYEAKGIETVRRDGCRAGVQLLHQSLCALFSHGDMSIVKRLVQAELSRLAAGTLPPQQLFFTREYHGVSGYRPGASAPPNEIAKRILTRDRRAVPSPGQRVPWLVCAGAADTALVRLAREPCEVARDSALAPHVAYYAARALLPPLHRCLSLLGADVFKWWSELGHSRAQHQRRLGVGSASGGIARYLWRRRCAWCGAAGARALCGDCAGAGPAAVAMAARDAAAERDVAAAERICESCCGHARAPQCESYECPVLWARLAARRKLAEVTDVLAHLPGRAGDPVG